MHCARSCSVARQELLSRQQREKDESARIRAAAGAGSMAAASLDVVAGSGRGSDVAEPEAAVPGTASDASDAASSSSEDEGEGRDVVGYGAFGNLVPTASAKDIENATHAAVTAVQGSFGMRALVVGFQRAVTGVSIACGTCAEAKTATGEPMIVKRAVRTVSPRQCTLKLVWGATMWQRVFKSQSIASGPGSLKVKTPFKVVLPEVAST